jgi:hypothetical protein
VWRQRYLRFVCEVFSDFFTDHFAQRVQAHRQKVVALPSNCMPYWRTATSADFSNLFQLRADGPPDDRLPRKPGAIGAGTHPAIHLGGDHHLIASGEVPNCAAQDFFAVAKRIAIGGIKEIDASLEGLLRPGRCRGGAAGDSRDYAGGVFAVYSAAGRVPP